MTDPAGFFLKQTTFAHSEHRTKFKVRDSLWNPVLDVVALASADGEICLKRVHWKTGWKKRIAPEAVFYSKWSRNSSELNKEDVGNFSCFAWSPDGTVLAVCFELGVCHLLDVNDGTILYTLRMNNQNYTHLKWLKLDNLNGVLETAKAEGLMNFDGSFVSVKSEHLRTKESDSCRDHYKIVQGIEHYCHEKIQKTLLDTILVAAGQRGDFVGFDVYMGGILLIKSTLIDDNFMSSECDRMSTEVSDVCLLPNSNLQIALATMSCGTPTFDEDCGFEMPAEPGPSAGSTLYLVEFDIGLRNEKRVQTLAVIAARLCHVFHLMTNIRETFLKTVSDWESQSEVGRIRSHNEAKSLKKAMMNSFHANIFKKLFENYQTQTGGRVSDFCLDFVGYILTGHAPESFAQSFFRDIKQKQWKPAKDFVLKHIPYLMNIVKRHLIMNCSTLFVHISALAGQLEELEDAESQKLFDDGLPDFMSLLRQDPISKPIAQCRKALVLTSLLRRKLKELVDVAGDNWAELKYMLQLLCTHPDNEGLEMEMDNDEDGAIKEQDFELLVKFVTNALLQPEARPMDWFDFMDLWMNTLKKDPEATKETKGKLVCNTNWLRQRTFDRIAPLLGVCTDVRPVKLSKSEELLTERERTGLDGRDFDVPLDAERIVTVVGCMKYIFDVLEEVYTQGIIEVKGITDPATPIMPTKSVLLEYCHPEPPTKITLHNWNDLKSVHEFMQKPVVESTLSRLQDFEECFDADFNSLVVVHRRAATTLQIFASIDLRKAYRSYPVEFCAAAPGHVLKLGKFGISHECRLSKSTLLNMFMNGSYHVCDYELYGAGSMYFMADVCDADQTSGVSPVYLIKCDVLGQMCFVDDLPITHSTDGVLKVAPRRAVGVLFERDFEFVKWFDLEMNSLNQPENDENSATGYTHSFSFSPLKYKREVKDNESMDLSQNSLLSVRTNTLIQIKTEPIEEDEEDEDIPGPVNLDDYAVYVELDSSPSPEAPRDVISRLSTPRRFLSTSPISEWRLAEERESPVNMRSRSNSSNSDSESRPSSANTVEHSEEDDEERRERLEQEEQVEGDPEDVSEHSNHVLEEVVDVNQPPQNEEPEVGGSDMSEQYYSFQDGDQEEDRPGPSSPAPQEEEPTD